MTCFLPVLEDGRIAKGHDETVKRYQVQIDGSDVSCHDEIVSVKSKKQGAPSLRSGQASASARQPKMLSREMNCPVVPKLIDDLNFSLIDLGTD